MGFWKDFLTPPKKPATSDKPPLTFKERFRAMRTLPAFMRLIWQTSPGMTSANIVLRLLKAAVPLLLLYVGKLILDEIIGLARSPGPHDLNYLWCLVAAELFIALINDLLGRAIAL